MSSTFRFLLRRVVPAAALMLAPVAASAQGFSFFGNFGSGPNAGTFAGTLTLAGFTAGATGTFNASSLSITQYPIGMTPSPEGNIATNWSRQFANSFNTVDGAITGWQFAAATGPFLSTSSFAICLNTGAQFLLENGAACQANFNLIGTASVNNNAFNNAGAQGLTFTPTATPVPEPASVALLLAGAGAMAVVSLRRRRNRAV
jgi:hypothetical protein